MALDESREKDETYEISGFTYVVDKDFMEKVQPVKVDFSAMGFHLSCAVDFSRMGGGSCGGCGSSKECC